MRALGTSKEPVRWRVFITWEVLGGCVVGVWP